MYIITRKNKFMNIFDLKIHNMYPYLVLRFLFFWDSLIYDKQDALPGILTHWCTLMCKSDFMRMFDWKICHFIAS